MPRKSTSLLFRGKASDFGAWSRELVHHKGVVNHQVCIVSSGVLAAGEYDFRIVPDHENTLEASVSTGKTLDMTGKNSAIARFNGVVKGIHLEPITPLSAGETISAVLSSYTNNDTQADSLDSTIPVTNVLQYITTLAINSKPSDYGAKSVINEQHSNMIYHQVTVTSDTVLAAGQYNVRLIPDVDESLEASVDIGKVLDIGGTNSAVVQFTGVMKGIHLEVLEAFTSGATISVAWSSSTERFDSIIAEDIAAAPLATAVLADNPFGTDRKVLVADGVDRKAVSSPVTIDTSGNVENVNTILLDPQDPRPAWQEGLLYYDNIGKALTVDLEEEDVFQQLGQEVYMRVYNDTVSTLLDGKCVSVISVNGDGVPHVDLTDCTDKDSALGFVGITTHAIESMSYGYVTISGFVRSLNTSLLTDGAVIWCSETTPGEVQETRPSSPNWEVRVGGVAKSDLTTGMLFSEPRIQDNVQDVIKFYNGSVLDPHVVLVESDGVTATLELQHSDGSSDMSFLFDQEFYTLPAPYIVTLTSGTDIVPQRNYVYIPDSTKVLTASTTGFPTTEQYVPIADVLAQSAASSATYGFYKVHAWTDHLAESSGQGHLSHINRWIRNRPAGWQSGVVLTPSVAPGTPATSIDLAYTSGIVYQLHTHDFAAFDSAVSDVFYIVDDPVTAYKRISSLNVTDISQDSTGASLTNKNYSLVLWGVVSEDAEDCQIMINLPSGFYTTEAGAIADASGYANYTIPTEYIGTGFLITRLVMNNGAANIKIVTDGIFDLRGQLPALGGGGTVGGAGVTLYTQLLDTDNSYVGLAGLPPVVNVGETGLEIKALSHTTLADKGTNTHPQIDTHLALVNNHLDWTLSVGTIHTDNYIENVPTSLSTGTVTATTYGITSDGGADDVVLAEATTSLAGLLSAAKWNEIVANTAKVTNVPTSLSTGTVTAITYGITSDGGTDDVVLAEATTLLAGLLSAAKYNEIVANTAKDTNVPTSLSTGTVTATTYGITSDGGTDDVVLAEATTLLAGLMSAAKYNEIVANTAKVTNATHTGQVTGATALALDITAITDQPPSGVIIGTDTILTNDGGVLSEATFTQLTTFFQSALFHDSFTDYVANEHIDWTSGLASADLITTGDGTFSGVEAVGTVTVANGILTTDDLFTLGASSATVPVITFDSGDLLRYDRTLNNFFFDIAGSPIVTIGGVFPLYPLDVTGDIRASVNVRAADSVLSTNDEFYLGASGATIPVINFDSGDFISYNRTSNTWQFEVGSVPVVAIGGGTWELDVTGSIQASVNVQGNAVRAITSLSVGDALGGNFGSVMGCASASNRFYIAPTDGAGGYIFTKELIFDVDGDAVWTAEGGFKTTGDLTVDGQINADTLVSTSNLSVSVGGSTRMTIQSSNGYVGILDTTPSYPLDVTGDIRSTGNVRGADFIAASSTPRLYLYSAGLVNWWEVFANISDSVNGDLNLVNKSNTVVSITNTGDMKAEGTFMLAEQSAAIADLAGYGQFWVKNRTPCVPCFTDDTGVDRRIETLYEKDNIIFNPTTSATQTLWYTNRDIQTQEVVMLIQGTGSPTAGMTIYFGSDRSVAGTTLLIQSITNTTTGHIRTTFGTSLIPANSWVWAVFGTVSGTTVTEVNIHYEGRIVV